MGDKTLKGRTYQRGEIGKGATRQAGRLGEEVSHQQKKKGAHGEEEGVEGEGEGGEDQHEGGAHGVQGAAHLTHMLSNSHEYRLHEAGGAPWSVGDLKIGEIR